LVKESQQLGQDLIAIPPILVLLDLANLNMKNIDINEILVAKLENIATCI